MNAFADKLKSALFKTKLEVKEVTPEQLWAEDYPMPKLDPKAILRVKGTLSLPCKCIHCDGEVKIQSNSKIYNGIEYGDWPYAFICQMCGAYVGAHPNTFIPLGTLATFEIREARKLAKNIFNELWEDGNMSRNQAYEFLAKKMGIKNKEHCHIGWFNEEQCNLVIQICEQTLFSN